MSHDYRIVVVGAGGVGKSALTVRFIQGNFVEKYDPTIEDSYRKQVEMDGTACMLDIMDTAGQEEYGPLRDQYMKTGQGFLIVYSITGRSTFEQAQVLKTHIERLNEEMKVPSVLVGNKSDLEDARQVTIEEGKAKAEELGTGFIETSAKTDNNVLEAFQSLVRLINTWREEHPGKDPQGKQKRSRCEML